MKYGIREICDVVLKAKANGTKVGNKTFQKNEPVIYFDSLKTSTMEGAATTVYAQGGRGNSRLVAWEGERTVTFTMEDALISELGLAVLTGAGLVDGTKSAISVHTTAKVAATIVDGKATGATFEISAQEGDSTESIVLTSSNPDAVAYAIAMDEYDNVVETVAATATESKLTYTPTATGENKLTDTQLASIKSVLFDFYVSKNSGTQIEITADKFAGNYYLEASTLFRSADGVDHPAEFIIPNCKIQSNFTFTMASSGDPSTFTFTMDAFPDYTKFDYTKKVLSVIQVIDDESAPLADEKVDG